MTVNELLKLISEIMGSDVKEVRLPERPGDIKISSADISLPYRSPGKKQNLPKSDAHSLILRTGTGITIKNKGSSKYPEGQYTDPFLDAQTGEVEIVSIREKVRDAPESWFCFHPCREREEALSPEY